MSIDFNKTFGQNSKTSDAKGDDRAKAQFWLNIGYDSGVEDADGKTRFVSLPTGIPLDTQEPLPTNSRNAEFRAFQSARNDLMAQILDVAKSLAPGEEKIIAMGDNGLAIQIRRVNEEQAEIPVETNQFARKVVLVA